MGRRASDKFIPNGDSDFARMARTFAARITQNPSRYLLSAENAGQITAAVTQFREALSVVTRPSERTKVTLMQKNGARAKAEAVVRKFANFIRANPHLKASEKLAVGVKERPERLKPRTCPQTPPLLYFKGTIGQGGLTGQKHVLHFCEKLGAGTRAKPAGAARVELFVELVAQDEPMPKHPGQLSGGRPWYLGSFNKNPIEVEFPVPAAPMLVVYWARWAGSNNDVGPFSRTCRAEVVGGFMAARALMDVQAAQRRQTKCIVTLLETPQRYLEQDESDALLLADETMGDEPVKVPAPKQLPEAA